MSGTEGSDTSSSDAVNAPAGPRTSMADRLVAPSEWRIGWAPQLDGLRAVATLFVMVFHFLSSFGKYLGGLVIGVDIFFALSGFLITTILFTELDNKGTISLRRFYFRRAIRLFPALYTLLAVFGFFALIAGGADRNHYLAEVLAAFFYVYNFFIAWVGVTGNALIQLWTLSIEQQFYLLWPLVFLVAFRPRRILEGTERSGQSTLPARVRVLLVVMAVFVIVLPLLRMTLPRDVDGGSAGSFVFGLSIMRPDAVALGCLAAFAMRVLSDRSSASRESRLSLAGNVALVVIIASVVLAPIDVFRPFVSPLANLAIFASAVFVFDLLRNPDKPVAKLLRSRALVWIGERSYAMYIWHLLLFFVLKGAISGAFPGKTRFVEVVTLPFALGATTLVAMASWRFVEQPAMKLRGRFDA